MTIDQIVIYEVWRTEVDADGAGYLEGRVGRYLDRQQADTTCFSRNFTAGCGERFVVVEREYLDKVEVEQLLGRKV